MGILCIIMVASFGFGLATRGSLLTRADNIVIVNQGILQMLMAKYVGSMLMALE